MKNIFLILISLSFFNCFANSSFAFKGLAQKFYLIDIYGQGMGETGVSDLFRINSSYNNPSLAATADNVIFSSAISMSMLQYKNDDTSVKDEGVYLPYFNFTVPVKKHKFAFSFSSLSSANLKVNSDHEKIIMDDTLSYAQKDWIESAIYNASILYANRNSIVNFGISADFYLGSYLYHQTLAFDNEGLNDSEYELDYTFKNPGFTVGLSKKLGNLSLGASYSSGTDMETDSQIKYSIITLTDITIGKDIDNMKFSLPETYNFGVTYRFLPTIKSSFDFHFEDWKNEYFGDPVQSSFKAGIGLAYDPIWGYGKWYEQIPVRVGYYYRKLPFKANDEDIIENAATLGLSIPLISTQKYLEFAFKYMVRGNVSDNLMQDNSFEISVGFSGFDIFQKKLKRIDHRDIPQAD